MNQILDTYIPIFFNFRISDVIDIALVSFIVYQAIRFVKETRAGQLLKGIVILLGFMYLSEWLNLNVVSFLLVNTMQVGLIALIVVFQPELRRGLEKVGRTNIGKILKFEDINGHDEAWSISNEISEAAGVLATERIGAIMVLERQTRLGDFLSSGTIINAVLKSELLINIFVPNTPLHDGAVIIRGGTIVAAACVLPLTNNEDLSRELGTRHRAALGISEVSDCIAVIVSEETGKISIAVNGSLTRNLTALTLKKALDKFLEGPSDNKNSKKHLKSWKGKPKND